MLKWHVSNATATSFQAPQKCLKLHFQKVFFPLSEFRKVDISIQQSTFIGEVVQR